MRREAVGPVVQTLNYAKLLAMADTAESDLEQLRSELQRAQQRNQELEAQLSADWAQQRRHWLYMALNSARIGVWEWDVALDKVVWSDALFEIYGVSRETFACTREAYMMAVHPDDRERVGKAIERAMTTEHRDFFFESRVLLPNGEVRHTSSYGLAVLDENGRPCQLSGAVLDLTERVREEQHRLTMQQELIEAQQRTLRELGAPIIPLAEGMLVMPLVGALDPTRAEQVLESLLDAVSARRAQTVILDITGVPTMDVEVARAIMKVVPAVRLLGAEVVLTGIQPVLARTLVELDIDMQQIVTRANLQEGLEHAALIKAQRRS